MACCHGEYIIVLGGVFILSSFMIGECLSMPNTTDWLQHPWKFAYNRVKNNKKLHISPLNIGGRVEDNASSRLSKNSEKLRDLMEGNETEKVSQNSVYTQLTSDFNADPHQSTVTVHNFRNLGRSSTLNSRLLGTSPDKLIIPSPTHRIGDSTSSVKNNILSNDHIYVNKRNKNKIILSTSTLAYLPVPNKRSFTASTISPLIILSTNSDSATNTPRQDNAEPVISDRISARDNRSLVITMNQGEQNIGGTLRPNINQPASISDVEHVERPSGDILGNRQSVVASSGIQAHQLDHVQVPTARQVIAQSEITANYHSPNQNRIVSSGTETATQRSHVPVVNFTIGNMGGSENTSLTSDNIIPATNEYNSRNVITPEPLVNNESSSSVVTSSSAIPVEPGGDRLYMESNTSTEYVGQDMESLTVSVEDESMDAKNRSEPTSRFSDEASVDVYTDDTLAESNTRFQNIDMERASLAYEHALYSSINFFEDNSIYISNVTSSTSTVDLPIVESTSRSTDEKDNSVYIQHSSSDIDHIQSMVAQDDLLSARIISPTTVPSSESTQQFTSIPLINHEIIVIESSKEDLHTYLSVSDTIIITSDMPNTEYVVHNTQPRTSFGSTGTEDIMYQDMPPASHIALPLLNKLQKTYSTIEPAVSTSTIMSGDQQPQLLDVRYSHVAIVIVEELHPSNMVPHSSVSPDDITDDAVMSRSKLPKGIFIRPAEHSDNEVGLINDDAFNNNIIDTNSDAVTQSGSRQQQHDGDDAVDDTKGKTTESESKKKTSKADNTDIKRIPLNDVTVYSARQPVPSVYIKLQLKMGWNEFCDSRVTFCLEIRDIVKNKTRKDFEVQQIVFMNVEISQCDINISEKTEEMIDIKMYFADQDRKFSSDLTQAGSAAIKNGFKAMNNSVFSEKVLDVALEITPYYPDDQNDPAMEPDLAASGMALVIVIATVGGVCGVVLVILQIILMKRRYSQKMRARRSESVALSSIRPRPRSHSGYTNPGLETDIQTSMSNPITFTVMAVYAMDDNICKEEFQILPKPVVPKTELPTSYAGKNRYSNILPTPSTRVKLAVAEDGSCDSDYINANYINNSDGTRPVYIATQAPTDATQTDFWRMVWEQQSRVIIMLCKLQERSMTCSSYWPDTDKVDTMRFYGDYEVVMKKREVKRDYTVSTLSLKFMEKNLTRDVKHIWFKVWPATGFPEALSLVRFVRDVIKPCTEQVTGPVIVHCSTGIGRTGILIVVVWLMAMYDKRKNIDVLRCVSSLRHQRAGMVQDWRQYMFIYKVLNEYSVLLNTLSSRSRSSTLSSITTIT